MRVLGRAATSTLMVLMSFLLGCWVAAPSYAVTYSRTAIAAYADRYSCNGFECRNSAYRSFAGTDCTNFASQAQFAGGLPKDPSYPYYWFYYNESDYTATWTVVLSFKSYMVDQAAHATILSTTMNATYTSASKGDVYMYDWGRGDGYSHLSISPGFGAFANYYDSAKAMNYRSVTSGSGDWLDQHSTDRYHAPWNWGYWTERDATVRSKMRTVIIHFRY